PVHQETDATYAAGTASGRRPRAADPSARTEVPPGRYTGGFAQRQSGAHVETCAPLFEWGNRTQCADCAAASLPVVSVAGLRSASWIRAPIMATAAAATPHVTPDTLRPRAWSTEQAAGPVNATARAPTPSTRLYS